MDQSLYINESTNLLSYESMVFNFNDGSCKSRICTEWKGYTRSFDNSVPDYRVDFNSNRCIYALQQTETEIQRLINLYIQSLNNKGDDHSSPFALLVSF